MAEKFHVKSIKIAILPQLDAETEEASFVDRQPVAEPAMSDLVTFLVIFQFRVFISKCPKISMVISGF